MGSTLLIIAFGFVFGALIQHARLNRFDTISGMAILEDFTVAKAMAVAIGVGAILVNAIIVMGWASFHAKPFLAGGIALGGLIFGGGMAILGYCPGTAIISAGEGATDAMLGILGGLIGGLTFALLWPMIGGLLGPDLGTITLHSLTSSQAAVFFPVLTVLGLAFVWAAFWMHKKEGKNDTRWLGAGLGLAGLNTLIFSSAIFDRQLGASSAFPFAASMLAGLTDLAYFAKIQKPGAWEMWFLLGALLSGLGLSLLRKDFRFRLIYPNWARLKGTSAPKRIGFALLGGFFIIFGARMAGGCTSGHVISGGMQLALSSLVFGAFVFAGLLITGKFFYRKAA